MRYCQLLMGLTLGILPISCTEETKVGTASKLDAKHMPTMSTKNISTLVSDSGITQYRIVSPLWEVYDEGERPYWRFPEGLYLRKFNRKFEVIATVAADSAVYFKLQRLWRLDGNVEITKEPGEVFTTQQVFWNQDLGTVYSDSFIHIENPSHVLEGYGFISDENFTKYRVKNPSGIFPVESMENPDAQSPTPANYPGISGNGNLPPTPGVATLPATPSAPSNIPIK